MSRTGLRADAHQIARTVGDLRIDEIEQDVEIVGRRVAAREMAGESARIDAPLDPPASIEDTPAGAANHVFLGEARDRGEGPQSRVGALESLGLGERPLRLDGEVAIEVPISCHVSVESRSRMKDAARRASRTSDREEP